MTRIFSKKLIYLLISWLIILGLIQLFLGGEIGYQSRQAAEIEEKILGFEKENSIIEEKIAQNSSLQLIEKEAKSQSLVKNTLMVDYSTELPVALKP